MAYDKFAAVDSSTLLFPPTVRANLAGTSPNYIINGGFDIWQRGTSFSFSTTNNFAYTADRWWIWSSGTASNCTISQQAFTPGNMPSGATESQYFLRFATTTITSSNIHSLWQKIEDVRTLAGQTVTLSFWAKADATRNFGVRGDQLFGTGGSAEVAFGIGGSFTATTAWQRFTATFTYPSIAGKTIGAGSSTNILFDIPQVNGSTFDIWGVQVEAGAVATPFRRNANSLQGELAACQRYYWRKYAEAPYGNLAIGVALSGSAVRYTLPMPVTMRTIPSSTIDWTGTGSNYQAYGLIYSNGAPTSLNIAEINSQFVVFDSTGASGMTSNSPYILRGNNNANAYLGFSAEL